MKVKEAKQNTILEGKKGLIVDKSNWNTENVSKNETPSQVFKKSSFDSLMDQVLILDRSIFEYKFIFAQNLQGGSFGNLIQRIGSNFKPRMGNLQFRV